MEKRGLSSNQAKDNLRRYGKNVLPEKPPPSDLKIFVSQLKNPLVYILSLAALVALFLNHISDSLIILSAVVINTVLGFVQERKASKALLALKKLLHPKAEVIRDGRRVTIDAEDVVVGDLVILDQGAKVPSDGVLYEASRFFINEAVLTGESVPVEKKAGEKVFMGTVVVSGRGSFIVEETGSDTKMGEIALKVQEEEEDTPLQKQMRKFSQKLSLLVFALTLIVFVVGIFTGEDVVDMFSTSVALAVSAIPEGLLVGLTVVLAVGMQRILKKKGLVRRLMSAETLGGVSVICVDKTGTLTKGQMEVEEVLGDESRVVEQMIVANDLDDPLVVAVYEWAIKKYQNTKLKIQNLQRVHKRLDSIPFSPKDRFFASLNNFNKKENVIYVNGAPEFVARWSKISSEEKKEVEANIERLTAEGKRVIGLARKIVPKTKKKLIKNDVLDNLDWVGLIALSDPVRQGVKEAFEETRIAGIETIVITGDYPNTAYSVMKQLDMDIDQKCIVTGNNLDRYSLNELADLMTSGVKLFARTTPEQKLKIVEALKKNRKVVAMMGDGVNDAPALKHADIGIVVGEASDVAKETADLILLDSNYTTIVSAIEEGRGIFENIRKIVLYLLSDAFEEIVAVVGTLLLGLPLPVTAGQILWINLVSDGFPDLALTIDPKSKGIMEKPPRNFGEEVVTNWMKGLIIIISFTGGVLALMLFVFYLNTTGDLILARSVAFSALGVNSLVFVFSVRTLTSSFWEENPLKNMWLNAAVLAGLLLQFLPFMVESLGSFFGLKYPGVIPMVIVFAEAIITFILIEGIKAVIRKKIKWFQH